MRTICFTWRTAWFGALHNVSAYMGQFCNPKLFTRMHLFIHKHQTSSTHQSCQSPLITRGKRNTTMWCRGITFFRDCHGRATWSPDHETTRSDKWGLKVHSCHTYWMTAAVNVFVQTQNKHSMARAHTSGGVEQTGALKFREIDLCYQTHNLRHCGHMAGGHVFQLVALEICMTEQADTQQPTKYSASGFLAARICLSMEIFPQKNPNNETCLWDVIQMFQ